MPQIKKQTKHSIYPKELRVQREDRSKKKKSLIIKEYERRDKDKCIEYDW